MKNFSEVRKKRLGMMRLRIKGAICLGLWHRTPFVTSRSKFEIGTESVNLLYVKQMTKQPWITSSITLIKHSRFGFVLLTLLVALPPFLPRVHTLSHITEEVEFLENHDQFYISNEIFHAKLIVVIHDGCHPRLFYSIIIVYTYRYLFGHVRC